MAVRTAGGLVERVDDAPVSLTATEFDLLAKLMSSPGRVFTREQLLSSVWARQTTGLRQVVDGLVENALRATPAGGRVSVTVRRAPAAFVVNVSDTGPGLAPEDLDVAFDRGALHAKYRQTRAVGTGLGLSIAARLVARMGGTLTAANGQSGAVFTVSLPTA